MQIIKTFFTVVVLLFAITGNPSLLAHATTMEEHQTLDAETKEKVDAILNNLNTELAKLGISFPNHHYKDQFAHLDDETKAKVKAIMDQVKVGSISKEEAHAKLKALGVSLPKHHKKDEMFDKLDDETKAQAKEIMNQLKNGTLTKEEAQTKLEALGVSIPKRPDIFANLDEETKAKAQALIEEAKADLKELGVEFPSEKFHHLME